MAFAINEPDFSQHFDLERFLRDRNFAENTNRDFCSGNPLTLRPAGPEGLSFLFNRQEIVVHRIKPERHGDLYGNRQFSYISRRAGPIQGLGSRGVMCESSNSVLIPPYFYWIRFYPAFRIFICTLQPQTMQERQELGERLYFFDDKGRFISWEWSKPRSRDVPPIALVEDPEPRIVQITSPRVHVAKAVRWNLFIIEGNWKEYGLADHTGAWLLPCEHRNIVIEGSGTTAIVQHGDEVFAFDPATGEKRMLPYTAVVDGKNGMVRVRRGKKWGMLDSEGAEIVAPEYDFIDYDYRPDRFRIFVGNYEWMMEDADIEYFNENLDNIDSWNGDRFYGRLDDGAWGVIDAAGAVTVAAEYSWIEELSPEYYWLIRGGKLYKHYDGDEKEIYLSMDGNGTGSVCDKNGHHMQENISNDAWNALLNEFRATNPQDFTDRSGESLWKPVQLDHSDEECY